LKLATIFTKSVGIVEKFFKVRGQRSRSQRDQDHVWWRRRAHLLLIVFSLLLVVVVKLMRTKFAVV